ncbi:hypothetical protein NQ317_011915, partial [Molorchus minor]
MPQHAFDVSDIGMNKVILAENDFNKPGPIDVLSGVDIFSELMCVGQINKEKGGPILPKTRLGWIVAGRLTPFDHVEEFETNKHFSKEERECEQSFIENFKRDDTGRFERLNTITYGTAPASFLAIRSLHQAAIENKSVANETIVSDFYMSGCSTVEGAKRLKTEISQILRGAGFELRKWNSNNKEILAESDTTVSTPTEYYINEDDNTRVLGLLWKSHTDILQYTVNNDQMHAKVTKRSILSTISKIFDPLGLLCP